MEGPRLFAGKHRSQSLIFFRKKTTNTKINKTKHEQRTAGRELLHNLKTIQIQELSYRVR
jgi:hypothetical protein